MQTAKDLTSSATSGIASRSDSQTRTTQGGSTASSMKKSQLEALVNRIFTRLEAIFPRTWRTAFSTENMLTLAKREVATSMAKWSVLPTNQAADMAVERIKAQGGEWPPSVASLVKSLQPRPEDFGMPESDVAFIEAIQHAQQPGQHEWSHPAVRVAGAAAGWFDLANATGERAINVIRSRFSKEYLAIVNRVMAGGEVEPRTLIAHDGQLTPAELAERNGREQMAAEAAKEFGRSMTAEQGVSALRNLLGRKSA